VSALDAVDAWRGEPGGGRRQINLLPAERRARHRDMRLPLNLGLAAFAVLLLFVNMDESLANRAAAVESMRAEVDKSNTEARQVAALRKTLADSIAGANFLTDKKRNNPLTVAVFDDLSRRLPEDTFLERLQIENGEVQLQGQSKEAAKLIAMLGASGCLGNPRLQGQIQPDARTSKERFQIVADVKPCSTPADVHMPVAGDASAKHDAGTSTAPAKADSIKPDAGKAEPPKKVITSKDELGREAAARKNAAMQQRQTDLRKDAEARKNAPPEKKPPQNADSKEPAHGGG
jgi:general secretion pathway protein L